MPTKKKAVKKPKTVTTKEFGEMMVEQVMQKKVQFARLKTKGDVLTEVLKLSHSSGRVAALVLSHSCASGGDSCHNTVHGARSEVRNVS